ncbi:MAG: DUF2254 domain-containing protein [Gemmatimonadota bacterium]
MAMGTMPDDYGLVGIRLRAWWNNVSGSLWFVPGAMILGAIALAAMMVELSGTIDRSTLIKYPRIFGAGAQSSRQMLSTIASAMMTVAGVTFSITVVAVTQASSQYTPRILRNFMRDRPSQITLGTLTGVFVYCLVVIRTVRGDQDRLFIPALAVLGAFVLAIIAIGVLVYFIHHVAGSLQASGILERVSAETIAAVERLFPVKLGEGEEAEPPLAESIALLDWCPVPSQRTGYIRGLSTNGLLRFAVEHDLIVRMKVGVGEHVVRGSVLASAAPAGLEPDDERSLAALYDIGHFRTVEQDAAFGIRQMVDMAVKALSPGINDTTTAVSCIDALGAVLVALADRRIDARDQTYEGRLRVIARGPTFESLVNTAVDEIRQNAERNVSVLARLLAMLAVVAERTASPARRDVLLGHATRILAVGERTVPDANNRAEIRAAFERTEIAARGSPPGNL